MYIYKITNRINGRIYIGQTVQSNPRMRWYGHTACVRKGKKSHLYDSMRKHGIDNFSWEIIDRATDLIDLNTKEKYWLDFYRAESDVYNARDAGNNKLHTAESKQKMSESQKQAHARRRALGTDTWTRIDGGAMKGKVSPKKGKPSKKWCAADKEKHKLIMKSITPFRGKTWKTIDGKRTWMEH